MIRPYLLSRHVVQSPETMLRMMERKKREKRKQEKKKRKNETGKKKGKKQVFGFYLSENTPIIHLQNMSNYLLDHTIT